MRLKLNNNLFVKYIMSLAFFLMMYPGNSLNVGLFRWQPPRWRNTLGADVYLWDWLCGRVLMYAHTESLWVTGCAHDLLSFKISMLVAVRLKSVQWAVIKAEVCLEMISWFRWLTMSRRRPTFPPATVTCSKLKHVDFLRSSMWGCGKAFSAMQM